MKVKRKKKHDFADRNEVARRMTTIYGAMLRSHEGSANHPFDPRVPLELQPVFRHFVSAAQIVIDEGADPAVYLEAQFEGLEWSKDIPLPHQLHTNNARLRYLQHRKRLDERLPEPTEDDYCCDPLELEQDKLERMAKSLGMSQKMVLRLCSHSFSSDFLESKGVAR